MSILEYKKGLTGALVLNKPNITKTSKIWADASDVGIDGVLTQMHDDAGYLIAYISKVLSSTGKINSVTERD